MSRSEFKIAVAGPIPRDTIITHKGQVIKKQGCVTHPTIALAKLLENEGTVYPIAHIYQEDSNAVMNLFNAHKNIATDGVSSKLDKGTIIELTFVDQNNRLEKQLSNMNPITPKDVSPFLEVDAFVFVPITDFEIELDTLKVIKEHSNAQIIFDAHGPTTKVDASGNRYRTYWADKDEWLPYIDVLKMNLEESQCSWYDRDYTKDLESLYDENNISHLDEFATYILNKGVSLLYITLDSRGCAIYSKENDTVKKKIISSMKVDNVIDTTGCGDSFAGGLAYGLVYYKDPIKAAKYANILGALRTQGKGFDVFKNKEETNRILNVVYP